LGNRDSILVDSSISKTTSWGAWRRHSPSLAELDFQLAQEEQVLVDVTVVISLVLSLYVWLQKLDTVCPMNFNEQFSLLLETTARRENDKPPERLGRIILKGAVSQPVRLCLNGCGKRRFGRDFPP
jgi:hypothetical protein